MGKRRDSGRSGLVRKLERRRAADEQEKAKKRNVWGMNELGEMLSEHADNEKQEENKKERKLGGNRRMEVEIEQMKSVRKMIGGDKSGMKLLGEHLRNCVKADGKVEGIKELVKRKRERKKDMDKIVKKRRTKGVIQKQKLTGAIGKRRKTVKRGRIGERREKML